MSPEEILKTQYSPKFDELRKNRMVVSYHKYGDIKSNGAVVDFVECMKQRIMKYEITGNTEWLVDVANFCMIEFMYPKHKKAHFRATDSNESPGLIDLRG